MRRERGRRYGMRGKWEGRKEEETEVRAMKRWRVKGGKKRGREGEHWREGGRREGGRPSER